MAQDFIAWEGTVKLVEQRTLALSEVVQELASSAESFESADDIEWIKEQGEELLELSAQQMEAIKVLATGAASLTQMNKDLMIQVQLAQGQIESLEISSREMSISLSTLREDQKQRDADDNIPRSNKALAKFAEQRAEQVKQATGGGEEEEEEDLQAKLDEALLEIEALKESMSKAEDEHQVVQEEMEAKLAAFQDSDEAISRMQIDLKDAQKQAQAAVDAKAKVQERLEQERLEKAEAVKTRDEELVRLRTVQTTQEKALEENKAKLNLMQMESKATKLKAAAKDAKHADTAKALAAAAQILHLLESEAQFVMETLGDEVEEGFAALSTRLYEADSKATTATEDQLELGHRKLAALCTALRRMQAPALPAQQTCSVQTDYVEPATVAVPESLWNEGEAGRELVTSVLELHVQVRGIFKQDPKSLFAPDEARALVHEVVCVCVCVCVCGLFACLLGNLHLDLHVYIYTTISNPVYFLSLSLSYFTPSLPLSVYTHICRLQTWRRHTT